MQPPSFGKNEQSSSSIQQMSTSTTFGGVPNFGSGQRLSTDSNDGNYSVHEIHYLSPYHNKWKIKAFVGSKSEIRRWQNKRGDGKLFNVTLLDSSGEIRATAFNQQVDEFYNVLQEGKLYYISKAKITVAKKMYSTIKHDYEITLESGTQIVPCLEDPTSILKFEFVHIANLMEYEKDRTIDIIGIVKTCHELQSITTKATQKSINKRELDIVDKSGFTVRLTLWGQQAENFKMSESPVVIVCKNVKVGDYQGRSLSAYTGTTLLLDPDIPEAKDMRDWYKSTGIHEEFNSFSGAGGSFSQDRDENKKTIEQVKAENLGINEKGDYFSTTAFIIFIKRDNISYPACVSEGCNKKVTDENTGEGWRCEKCSRTYSQPNYRYIMSVSVADYTDSAWFQCFNEAGERILEYNATALHELRERDEAASDLIIEKAYFKPYVFRCRAKIENYNDSSRVRYTVISANPVDFIAQSREMLRNISAMESS
ncbi:5391_t:CDS:10 [Acaulospora morrowiae]|uniref:Replication protein A subunit n=1 Tax=Acaulospora morrowiae TaxID=94023 RepID=A0A9N8VE85_9GLOM|nr:5391_t:CDS:10 [Acaulospora morrowiae]